MRSFKFLAELKLNRVLIAYSGGPDSQALLHAFKDKFCIGVAHVDHGWREESREEACQLKNYVESLGIPFYLKRLDISGLTGNLEQLCREERYRFFSEICAKEHYEAVLLGHHQDDQAETVLKRVLEGASFPAIEGIKKSTVRDGLLILRPFLEIPKNELVEYLIKEKISYLEDRSNVDSRYLRAKMRTKILPELNREFGKSVQEPLVRLAKECEELNSFMGNRFEDLNSKLLDLSSIKTIFEVKWALRAWLKGHGLSASYTSINEMGHLILEKKGDKQFFIGNAHIELDRGRLFLMKNEMQELFEAHQLNKGIGRWGPWTIKVETEFNLQDEIVGWTAAWNGKLECYLPEGVFELVNYVDLVTNDKKNLQTLWTKRKIPAFFRKIVPVISSGNHLIREFLSGVFVKNDLPCKKVILYRE